MKLPLLIASLACALALAFLAGRRGAARAPEAEPARSVAAPRDEMPALPAPPATVPPTLDELQRQERKLFAAYKESYEDELRRSHYSDQFTTKHERMLIELCMVRTRGMVMGMDEFAQWSAEDRRLTLRYLPHLAPEELLDSWPLLKELRACRARIAALKQGGK